MDLLKITAGSVDHERLADGDDTLLGSRDGTLEDEEIVLDDTVVGEATHGRDLLVGDIRLGRGVSGVLAGADAVDLLVELSTMMVTVWLVLASENVKCGGSDISLTLTSTSD